MNNVHPLRHYPPGDECLLDVIHRAIESGQRLVTTGRDIYITPVKMPGEFEIAVRVVEPAGAAVRAAA